VVPAAQECDSCGERQDPDHCVEGEHAGLIRQLNPDVCPSNLVLKDDMLPLRRGREDCQAYFEGS
jgi:hypothetical protein